MKMWLYTHTQSKYSAIENNEILTFLATQMDLEGIMLSEISQTVCGITYMQNLKYATRIYCTTWGIQPVFYNNYKWSITFKNCESLYCILVTYIILYISYTSVKKIAGSSVQRQQLPLSTSNSALVYEISKLSLLIAYGAV